MQLKFSYVACFVLLKYEKSLFQGYAKIGCLLKISNLLNINYSSIVRIRTVAWGKTYTSVKTVPLLFQRLSSYCFFSRMQVRELYMEYFGITMKNKSIKEVANSVHSELIANDLYVDKNILKDFLQPCMAGKRAEAGTKSISKIGGYPLLPKGFEYPKFDGQNLKFFCQIDFSEIASLDISNRLPSKGTLVIFMHLEDEKGELRLPLFNHAHLKSYYFEDIDLLTLHEIESINCKHLEEVKLDFKQYMDFPNSSDFRLKDINLDYNIPLALRFELLANELNVNYPSFVLLGYSFMPDLAHYDWYCFDGGINLLTPGDKSKIYTEADKHIGEYSQLLAVSLEDLGALKLEDEFAEFGLIRIGIKTSDLENRIFKNLKFSYFVS